MTAATAVLKMSLENDVESAVVGSTVKYLVQHMQLAKLGVRAATTTYSHAKTHLLMKNSRSLRGEIHCSQSLQLEPSLEHARANQTLPHHKPKSS